MQREFDKTSLPTLRLLAPNIVSQLILIGIPDDHSYNLKYGQINRKNIPGRHLEAWYPQRLCVSYYPLDIPLLATKVAACPLLL